MNLWNYIFHNQTHPKWLVRLNYISLAGIVAWPLVAFTSIFLLDHPTNLLTTYFYIFLIDTYPIPLLLLTWLSFKLYPFSRVLAAAFPMIPILLYGFGIGMMIF